MRDVKREEEADQRGLREVRQAHGHQVGAQRPLPGLLRLPRLPQHQGVHAQRRRQPHHRVDDAPVGSDLPDLRLADADQARALRRVPGLLALPRLQDHQPDLAGRRLPEGGLRRLPHGEALAARQGVLRLLELLEDPVRLRVVGSPAGPALSQVRRQVHRPEDHQGRYAHPLPQGGLRLHRRRREPRGERSPGRPTGTG